MPKMKTKKAAAKRFHFSGSGRVVKYKMMGSRHILTKKSSKRKRNFRNTAILDGVEKQRMRTMLPYG